MNHDNISNESDSNDSYVSSNDKHVRWLYKYSKHFFSS